MSFQKLRVMQRKLEEHEEALLGRAQVVDLLQKELNSAEQRNQVQSVLLLPARGRLHCTLGSQAGVEAYEPSDTGCHLGLTAGDTVVK